MTNMTFTADMLDTHGAEETNLILLTGTIGDALSWALDSEIEGWADMYQEETGRELPKDWLDHVTWNYEAMYKELAEDLGNVLEEAFPELFTTDTDGDAPVMIGKVRKTIPHDPHGWGREAVMADIIINGDRLKDMADEYAITEIDDGREISGFFRTASDEFWAQTQVIRALMEEMDDHGEGHLALALDEYAFADGWVGEHVSYGELEEDLNAAV